MFLEISRKGIKYQERLHNKERKSSQEEGTDEMLLVTFRMSTETDPEDFLEGFSSPEDKGMMRKGIRRLFEAGYLKET